MDIGIFHGTFRLRDGGRMQSLTNIFLYGFQGRIQDLANENNYSLTTKTEGGYHIVTGTTNKKRLIGIGYKQVVFKYQVNDLMLKEIVLLDYSDNKDTYTVSNVKYNVAIDKKKFQF
jgi:outer membrane lipoprotein-sorting protein